MSSSVGNGRFHINNIAVFRALPGLGDFLCIVPALRALRCAFPRATISLIGLAETWPLVSRYTHYIDSFLPFPGFPGLSGKAGLPGKAGLSGKNGLERTPHIPEVIAFLSAMQGRFDLALQMHGSGLISNSFALLLGAPLTSGFFPPEQQCPNERTFLPYPTHFSEVQRYLALLKFLGIASPGKELEFAFRESDELEFATMLQEAPFIATPYVCLHPGASETAKRWSPTGFAQLGDRLAERGFQVLLTGTEQEKPLATAVAETMHHPAINLAGQTTLGSLALLLQGARLLICNDTGVSHLADALHVPSVVIFSPASDPVRWAPHNQQRHRVVVTSPKNGRVRQPSADWANAQTDLAQLTAVWAEVQKLLAQEQPNVI
ncbi:MAG: glycosyltransferase family 9 protein [Anaerolineaceae bacterium]|nr:glycosyltransferase family 9 protein [Anaerolineaceae bacterium]